MELPDKIEGLLLYDVDNTIQIRIVDEKCGFVRAVKIHPLQLDIRYYRAAAFAADCLKGKFLLVKEEPRIVDEGILNARDLKNYHERLEIIKALKEILGNDLLGYTDRANKAAVDTVYDSFGVKRGTFRHWLLRYIQSGQQKWSLLNQFKSVNGRKRPVSRNIQNKLGKKPGKAQGKILDEYDYRVLDEFLRFYRQNISKMKFTDCWRDIRQQFYNELTITGKGTARKLIPVTEYPTEAQVRYYADQRLSPAEKILSKMTKKEARNNTRNLNGDTRFNVKGPMAVCECDAWDAGIILIDNKHPEIKVGKPSVYAIVDVYSGAVVTFYITYDRDNIIGLSSMMLSLMDDKKGLAAGRVNPEAVWFPGSYLPTILRTDRGPDFTSDAYETICNRLEINRELVPGAMGSLKPNVERLWGRIDSLLTSHVTKKGKINHKYGEKPYKDAILTINEYTKIVTEAVIAINSEPILGYPVDSDMIAEHVDLTPRSLWNYGVKKYGEPRSILNKEQFLFDLLLESTAKVTRSGTTFNSLFYDNPEDKRLQNLRIKTQDKDSPLTVRYDPRSVGTIWYHWPDETFYRQMNLMPGKSGMVSFAKMSFQEYMAYLNEKKMIISGARQRKDEVRTAAYFAEKTAVGEIAKAKKDLVKTNQKPTKKALVNAKYEERERISISNYLDSKPETLDETEKPEERKKWVPVDYETALAEFDD